MEIFVLDIGGTNVKLWTSGEAEKEKFPSGKEMTPAQMVEGFKALVGDRKYDRISIGYPGEVLLGRPVADPVNLGPGWVNFEYHEAFGCPVRIMNDACMQALGSYEGGRMLYLGLGTGVGSAFIIDGKVVPLALGDLKFHRGETFDHYLSRKGYERYGEKGWRRAVADAAAQLKAAFFADYVVFGGGNAKKIEELPPDCRRGGNHNAYFGGIRMWEDVALQEGVLAPKMENPVPDPKLHETHGEEPAKEETAADAADAPPVRSMPTTPRLLA